MFWFWLTKTLIGKATETESLGYLSDLDDKQARCTPPDDSLCQT
jgi:hypothetical protein